MKIWNYKMSSGMAIATRKFEKVLSTCTFGIVYTNSFALLCFYFLLLTFSIAQMHVTVVSSFHFFIQCCSRMSIKILNQHTCITDMMTTCTHVRVPKNGIFITGNCERRYSTYILTRTSSSSLATIAPLV